MYGFGYNICVVWWSSDHDGSLPMVDLRAHAGMEYMMMDGMVTKLIVEKIVSWYCCLGEINGDGSYVGVDCAFFLN